MSTSSDLGIQIRPLVLDDGPYLLTWRNDPTAYVWFRDARPLSPAEHHVWLSARLVDAEPSVWVAVVNGEPAGCVRLDTSADGSAEVSIVVDAARRGLGLGAALLDHCTEVATARGLQEVRAEVHASNAASLALFTRHRFTPTGRDGEFIHLRLN